MAEIKIEKKTNYWPWIILGLVILGLLGYFLLFTNDDDDLLETDYTEEVEEIEEIEQIEVLEVDDSSEEIADYLKFIAEGDEMTISHDYSNDAITKLVAAVRAVGNEKSIDINASLDKAVKNAHYITKDPYEVDHADHIKQACLIISEALETIQNESFPNLNNEIISLKKAAKDIDIKDQTLEQKNTVKNFYKNAASVLKAMR